MRIKGRIKIDYDFIGQLVGIASDTAKQYAYRGEYDPRNLDSLLRWINGRRLAKITDSWKSIQTLGGVDSSVICGWIESTKRFALRGQ